MMDGRKQRGADRGPDIERCTRVLFDPRSASMMAAIKRCNFQNNNIERQL